MVVLLWYVVIAADAGYDALGYGGCGMLWHVALVAPDASDNVLAGGVAHSGVFCHRCYSCCFVAVLLLLFLFWFVSLSFWSAHLDL